MNGISLANSLAALSAVTTISKAIALSISSPPQDSYIYNQPRTITTVVRGP